MWTGGVSDAVSYTHLDVYKRQTPPTASDISVAEANIVLGHHTYKDDIPCIEGIRHNKLSMNDDEHQVAVNRRFLPLAVHVNSLH